MKSLLKLIFNVLATLPAVLAFILKPLIKVLNILCRSIYSQYIRFAFNKSHISTTINFPILLVGGKYITSGKNLFLGANGILSAWESFKGDSFHPEIIFGDNVTIGNGFHISAINKIHLGNNILMGKYVTIVDNEHGNITFENLNIPPIKRRLSYSNGIFIEDNVWIGDKVTICSKARIGYGAVIGANSVVTGEIPPFSVAAGSPARIIKIIEPPINNNIK